MGVYDLSAEELYDSYAQGIDPAALLEQSRIDLATRLRVDEGLTEEDTYYAADRMLALARLRVEGQRT